MNLSRQICAAIVSMTALVSPAIAGNHALTKVGDLSEATRPHGVPLDYVVTPNGLFHPSCVVAVADGERVAANGDVVRHDGSVEKASACAHPRYVARDGTVERIAPHGQKPAFDGWIASSNSNSNVTPPAKKMVATFVVPSGPTTRSGQVLYYFPGLEDGSTSQPTILQPVLAWNGFGDSRWTMTNWNCCKSGKTWHGSTIAVSTGNKIKGSMLGGNCANGVCTSWTLKSVDKNTGQSTTFLTESYGQQFDWYFGGAKEAYGVSRCSHYPANGSITFSNIHVYDLNGVETTPATWNTFKSTSAPSCNYGVAATRNVTKITFSAN